MSAHPAARYVSLALIYIIWGSTYLAVRVIVGDEALTPLQLQLLRSIAATVDFPMPIDPVRPTISILSSLRNVRRHLVFHSI